MKAKTLLVVLVLLSTPVAAQQSRPDALREVGIDQRLNGSIPLNLIFHDENGRPVRLKDCVAGKPVILNLVYYRCPMLCTQVTHGLLSTLKAIPSSAGRDFTVITASIDPTETPALARAKKAEYLSQYGRPGAERGWHFLTGDADSIRKLTDAAGFRYNYLPEKKQFAHAAGIMVATPDGRLARYFYGIEYQPRDVRLALDEASAGRIGGLSEQALLFCYQYDPVTGKYGLAILRIARLGGAITALGLTLLIAAMLRRERRKVGA